MSDEHTPKKRSTRRPAVPLMVRPFSERELSEQDVQEALKGGRHNGAVCALMQEMECWMASLNAEGHRGVASASAGFLAVSEFYTKMKGLMS